MNSDCAATECAGRPPRARPGDSSPADFRSRLSTSPYGEGLLEERSCTSPFLTAEEVAKRYRCSIRSIHELARTRRIPHRRLAGSRRCLFRKDELEAWEDGAALEVIEPSGGGRVVRPRLERA
jgi:excisionase family DNA binding protein